MSHDPGDESTDRPGNWCAFCGRRVGAGRRIVPMPNAEYDVATLADFTVINIDEVWNGRAIEPMDDITTCNDPGCIKAGTIMQRRLRLPATYRYDTRRYISMCREKLK